MDGVLSCHSPDTRTSSLDIPCWTLGIRRLPRSGFTLLEILLAVALLAVATSVTYMAFSTVASAWKRSQALSFDIHHADFVMEQLEMALRSAYYQDRTCGFVLEDGGDGPGASDKISWVKLGGALVGADCPFIGTPHRIKFFLEDGKDDKKQAAITAWRVRGQADDFDPDKLESTPISKGITGFNCRPRDPLSAEVEWLDEWEDTNKIPTAVELTLYMDPLDKGDDPVEIKRIVEVPVASVVWGGSGTPSGNVLPGTGRTGVTARLGRTDPGLGSSLNRPPPGGTQGGLNPLSWFGQKSGRDSSSGKR